MAEDTFIREVDEQMRQDRANELWSKYGKIIIALAVLIVAATAGIKAWQTYNQNKSAGFGDRFLEAVSLSDQGKPEEAISALKAISNEGSGQYPALAKIRIASEIAQKGDKKAAIAAFDDISKDTKFNDVLRDVATLRAGLLAVDVESYQEVANRLEQLAAPGTPFRHSAREALGISALKAGEDQKAYKWFESIQDDQNAAAGARGRAATMLNFLAGKGIKAGG